VPFGNSRIPYRFSAKFGQTTIWHPRASGRQAARARNVARSFRVGPIGRIGAAEMRGEGGGLLAIEEMGVNDRGPAIAD